MNEYTRRLFSGKCPYTDKPCNNNDSCETCEVEEERKEEERLDKAEQQEGMTREEASIIIGNIPINSDECYTIPEYQQAKVMAIKALEHPERNVVAVAPSEIEILKEKIERYEKTFDKIKAKIEPKCDSINSLASELPYTAHREIQELLCEIMDLCKAESEGEE